MTTTEMHPHFPAGANVRSLGYKTRGTVTHSAPTSVYVAWDNGTVGHYDGWQAGNHLRKIA